MIPPQPPDDIESADDIPGPDLCALLDEYWEALRSGSAADLQRLLDRDQPGGSIAEDFDILNLLHQVRSGPLGGDEGSQLATVWLSEPFAMQARSQPRGAGAGASPSGMEGQTMVDEPRQIGKYQVLELLGAGGQAQIFRVNHPELAKEFVLKLALRPMATEDQADRDALRREGRLLAQCEHPNLVRVNDLDVHEGRWFVVMEYVSGLNLAQLVAQSRPEPRRAARLVIELAQAVAYLHARGITHQDIKPQNVLVDHQGRPRLIDFGLARLKNAWRDGSDDRIGGTARYMSPEQTMGCDDLIGPRTDVFGLGGILYFLLTGRPLFLGSTPDSALRRARKTVYTPVHEINPRVPRSLERICHKALAADPDRRYASAAELEHALRQSLELRRIAAAGLIVSALIAAVLLMLRLSPRPANPGPEPIPRSAAPRAETPSPPVALKILEFKVKHYRGDNTNVSLGTIGELPEPIRFGDDVRVQVQLSAPAYCYVIALNPDSEVQLCLPSNPSEPPARSELIHYPVNPNEYFMLNDGSGEQAFVVVAATRPLTSFENWKGRDDLKQRWKPVPAEGVWSFDGHGIERVDSGDRGDVHKGVGHPPGFDEVCQYLMNLPDIEAIRAFAFPVKPKK
jgi:serine/threonine protein kinase